MKVFKRLVLVSMLALAGCGSSEDSAASFIKSGDELFAEGNLDKARVEYKNALQIDPRQAEPYYRLALIDEDKQNWKEMFNNLRAVEQLNPNHTDALVKLGRIYLLGGEYDEAMSRAEKALSLDPEHVDGLLLKASVLSKQGQYEAAQSTLDTALTLDSGNLDALSLRVLNYRDSGDMEQALALLDEAIALHPDETPLYIIKLSVLEKTADYPAMVSVYEQLIQQQPDEHRLVISYSQLLNNQLNQYEEAVSVLEQYVESHPESNETKQVLVGLVNSKQPEKAIRLLESFITAEPENYELKFTKVALLTSSGDVEQAQSYLESMVSSDSEGSDGNKARAMLAGLHASKNNFEKARELVEQVLALAPEHSDALLIRAKLNLQDKNVEQAVTDLRTVIRNEPNLDEAMVLLAQAYVQMGSTELAEDSFRQALSVNPQNTQAALFVANSLRAENDFDRMEDVLMDALKNNPNKPELLEALAQVRILKQDWNAGIETVELLNDTVGETPLSHLFMGQLYQGQGDFSLAAEEYKSALLANPDMVPALEGLAVSLEQLGEHEQLIQYLTEYNSQYPNKMIGYAILAVSYFRNDKPSDGEALLLKQIDKHEDWSMGYRLLSDHYLMTEQTDKAVSLLEQGMQSSQTDSGLGVKLASLYESQKDFKNAKVVYEKVLERDSSNDIAANNLASILTDVFASEENIDKALALSSRFKDATEPYFLDTYAWANVKAGNLDEAQPILELVVSSRDDVAVFNYHLGVLLSKKNQPEQASRYLEIAKSLANQQGDAKLIEDIEKVMKSM